MSILITGGAGFVAATLTDRLLAAGESVVAFDNLSRGTRANIEPFLHQPRFNCKQVELSNFSAFRRAAVEEHGRDPIHEVWHLAANSDIPAGVRNPDIDLRDTFMTTYNTLKVMDELGIGSLLFASSSAIYGDLGDAVLTENTGPLFPISNYGAMKLASEAAITAAAERFLQRALIFRFPNVVGVPATHGVILDFITRLKQTSEFLQVLGDGTQQKAYLHVSDLVQAMLLIRERSASKVDVFNVGPTDEGVTVRRIAQEVIAVVAPGAELRFETGNKGWIGDVPRFRYSTEKLQKLNWKPALDSLGAIQRATREIAHELLGSFPDAPT